MTDNGGFTLNGTAVSTYGVTLKYAPGQPMLPETRDRTAEIPGRHGTYWFDSDLGQRRFSLPCMFTDCADAAALDTLIMTFGRVLVDVNGKPKALSLIFDDAPTITYTVRYAGEIPFDRAWCGMPEFSLNLVADDPFGYEAEDTTSDTLTASPGAVTVESDGNANTPARVCVTNNGAGAIDGFTITIEYVLD
jgi:phage-related protein